MRVEHLKKMKPEYIFYFFLSFFLSALTLFEEIYSVHNGQYLNTFLIFFLELPFYLGLTILIGKTTVSFLNLIENRFNFYSQIQRLLPVFIFSLMMTFLFTALSIFLADNFEWTDYTENESKFVAISFFTFFLGQIGVACYHEFVRYNNRKNTAWRFKRHFADLNMRVQYEALKRQINPHFFFNSLAALSSLVYEDALKSDSFIQKFSIVFRYIFKENHEKLVSLKQEFNFMEAYLGIVQVRIGAYLVISKESCEDIKDKLIPALTTQLIFDDIFNNNRIGKQYHLFLDVNTQDNNLYIRNNCNPKRNLQKTNQLDIELLKNRYSALGYPDPEISFDNNIRTIKLPLIRANYEHNNQFARLSQFQ